MGAGGRMSVPLTILEQKKKSLQRVPHSKPPFTLGDIKKSIPPHCFERSLVHSFSYVVFDLSLVFMFYYIATSYFHLLPFPLSYLLWPVYWIMQGCVCTGVWVIAHECGHHAFSDYQCAGHTVGLIFHSALLVPYFSWKYSHRRHHSNTGSLERDEVFVPKQKSRMPWFSKYLNNPPGRLITLLITLTLGWPLYLAFNVSGRPYDRFACHFDPYGPIYNERERLQIYISDAGIFATTYVLYHVAAAKGLAWLIGIYGIPLLIVNGFLVMITFLQHTRPSIPHYDSSEWDWLRGALATVDRDYGVLNKIFHNITDTQWLTISSQLCHTIMQWRRQRQSSLCLGSITNSMKHHFTRQCGGKRRNASMLSRMRVPLAKVYFGIKTNFDNIELVIKKMSTTTSCTCFKREGLF